MTACRLLLIALTCAADLEAGAITRRLTAGREPDGMGYSRQDAGTAVKR